MDTMHPHCAGLDVHKDSVAACVRHAVGKPREEVRTFGTMTSDLSAPGDWLAAEGVTHAAMESTGVYWKPVWNLLEGRLALMLVNAQHVKQVPGRKTDVKDCQWIAQLLRHGLLRPSFVPDRPQRELRDLTRQRAQLVADKARVSNRIQKVLEDANVKLGSVASDVLGASRPGHAQGVGRGQGGRGGHGRAGPVPHAGQDPPAPRGPVRQGDRRTTGSRSGLCWQQVEGLDAQVAAFDARVEAVMTPLEREAVKPAWTSMPGVQARSAQVVVAEVGTDMGRFPSAGSPGLLGRPVPRQQRGRRQAADRPR